MTEAMPNMRLPFAAANPAPTVMALDRAVFEGHYTDSSPNSPRPTRRTAIEVLHCMEMWRMLSLDYHLWALSLVMGAEYKAHPMSTSFAYDVSAFNRLRKIGQVRLPPAAASVATTARYAEVKLLERVVVQQMCDAFGIAPPDASELSGASTLARLESCVSEDTGEAAAFWSALGDGADNNAKVTIACMAVVRASSRPAAGGPPPPPARPPPPAPVSADGIFKHFYDGFVGDPLATAKALSLQVLFPVDVCLYRNERVVGAGAYDDAIKT